MTQQKQKKPQKFKYVVTFSIETETKCRKAGLKKFVSECLAVNWPSVPEPIVRVRTVDLD